MDENAVIYQNKERVSIISDDGKDYLVYDHEKQAHYSISHTYFRSHYECVSDRLPVHTEIWDKLDQQAHELHQLKKANTNLHRLLSDERKENNKLRDEAGKKRKPPLRKGRKRGKYGRNG